MIGQIIGTIGGIGVNMMLTPAMKALAPAADKIAKIGMTVGTMAVSTVIGKACGDMIDEDVDKFKKDVEAKKKEILEAQAHKRVEKEAKRQIKEEQKKEKKTKKRK